MLPRLFRLKKQYEFRYVYKKGKSLGNRDITLFYSTNKNHKLKIGFSINNKFGCAVERNRAKRQFRSICSELLPVLKNEYNYVFVIKPEIKEKSFSEKRKIIMNLLFKNQLIKTDSKDVHND